MMSETWVCGKGGSGFRPRNTAEIYSKAMALYKSLREIEVYFRTFTVMG